MSAHLQRWRMHEDEYCVIVSERPIDEDIFTVTSSWAEANHEIDAHEHDCWDGNGSRLKAVRFQDDYFVVHCDSLEQEAKYLRQESDD